MSQTLKSGSIASALFHETLAAIGMASHGLAEATRYGTSTRDKKSGRNILWLPGFQGPHIAYFPVARWAREHVCNIGVSRVADFGWFNRASYERQRQLLQREVVKFRKVYGPLHIVVGHSLGGIEGVSLLPYIPEIEKVVCIASPFNFGTPWRIIEFGSRLIAVPESMRRSILEKIVAGAREHVHKIVTISSEHDKLCPPPQAAFPMGNARNIIVKDADVIKWTRAQGMNLANERRWLTHTGLPNSPYVRHILKSVLEG